MKSRATSTLLALCGILTGCQSNRPEAVWSTWDPLPPPPGGDVQPGLAGAFAGTHNGALIVAGGANFPTGVPWRPGAGGLPPEKVFHRHIYVGLPGDGGVSWKVADAQLPRPLAYGVSAVTADGLLCVGGETRQPGRAVSAGSVLLSWDPAAGRLSVRDAPLAPLPEPAAAMAGAVVDGTLFVAGGDDGFAATKNFWSIDLQDPGAAWQELPAWPGPARLYAAAAAQSNGSNTCFYLFSGREVQRDKTLQILTDAYVYDPVAGTWEALPDVGSGGGGGGRTSVMGAAAIASGRRHILVFGGDDGRLFRKLEVTLPARLATAREIERNDYLEYLQDYRVHLLDEHPGFSDQVRAFNTVERRWFVLGRASGPLPVTTTAVDMGGDTTVIPSGESRPGVRTPNVRAMTLDFN